MRFEEHYLIESLPNIEYVYGDDIDSSEIKEANNIAKEEGISIFSDKNVQSIAKSGDEVIGALWSSWETFTRKRHIFAKKKNIAKFEFDIVVKGSFQGKGVGGKLLNIAIDKYNSEKEEYDEDTIIKAIVVNSKMERMLIKKGFKVVRKEDGITVMIKDTK